MKRLENNTKPKVMPTPTPEQYAWYREVQAQLAGRVASKRGDKCKGCGGGDCSRLWAQQKKCCPDCTHGKPGQ